MAYDSFTEDDYLDEVTSDVAGQMFEDSNVANFLVPELNKSTLQKILDVLKKLLEKVGVLTPEMESLVDKWNKAYESALESNLGVKSQADGENDTKFSKDEYIKKVSRKKRHGT